MEDIYELMKSPMSTLVSMLLGFPLFTLGVAWMGIFISESIETGISYVSHVFMATAVTVVGLVSLSLGFIGLTEMIIEKELSEQDLTA